MLDHISFSVTDYRQSVKFYDETLKILKIDRLMTFETEEHRVAGYGSSGKPYFWIGEDSAPNLQESIGKARGFHVAFQAPTVESIHAWHQKCLEMGAINKWRAWPSPRIPPRLLCGFYNRPKSVEN